MDGIEEEKEKLVVKLPVKTPTPEKKTVIKLRLSPEKERSKPISFFSPKAEASNAIVTSASGSTGSPDGPVFVAREKAPPPNENGSATKPMPLAPMSPSQQPLSPLAFRGNASPEKPSQPFSAVDVGV